MPEKTQTVTGDIVIIGGGIGCLVAALSAADAGAEVSLLLPERGIGAGFATRETGGFRLDVGCRRLDLTQDETVTPLADYRPGMATRPFAPHIRTLLEQTIGMTLVPTSAPLVNYGGLFVDDFVTSLDLTSLPRLLNATDLKRVESETKAIIAAQPAGPMTLGLGNVPDLGAATLEEASLANHGATFHDRFIAPFAQKVFPEGWTDMPADLAPKIWTPLLYPRTVNEGCHGRIERERRAVTYFYPANGYFGELVEKLLAEIKRTSTIQVVQTGNLISLERTGAEIVARQSAGPDLHWQCPFVLGTSVGNYCDLAGRREDIDQLSLAILWAEVSDGDLLVDPGLINVFDPDMPVYRVSFGGDGVRDGRHILTIEMTGGTDQCTEARASGFLKKMGVLRPDARIQTIAHENSLKVVAPSAGNRRKLREARARLADRGIEPALIGTLNDLKADTLNDHILQGMTAVRQVQQALP